MSEKAILIILDGWGIGSRQTASAVYQAKTPFMDYLMTTFPNSQLTTYGLEVGLPEGQMGNSEVGHLNIGAGRIVDQELVRINKAVRDDTLKDNKTIQDALEFARRNDKSVHLIGLVSDGGVHSHINHLIGLADIVNQAGTNGYIHAFLDGRDTDPKAGLGYLRALRSHISGSKVRLSSVIGRYYAMDRDRRWERTKLAYDLLVNGKGSEVANLDAELTARYHAGETDEFVKPIKLLGNEGNLEEGDVVLFFNFRTDRPRQLTEMLSQSPIHEVGSQPVPIKMVTMTEYDSDFKGIDIVFHQDILRNTFGEIVSNAGLKQVRIAETEKYPHVTYFFSGGREKPFDGEERIMIPSPKVATYDLQPEMSAFKVTDAICQKIRQDQPEFVCLNFANADMVGHTGDFDAGIAAVEAVDDCLNKVVIEARKAGYEALIIADHGNADYMINEDGSPNTAHTKNPVPCIYIGAHVESVSLEDGILADIAPTLAGLMKLDTPKEFTGRNLLKQN